MKVSYEEGHMKQASPPIVGYILLGINASLWLLMTIAGVSTRIPVLIRFGAQQNELVLEGQYWRLLSSMFLHFLAFGQPRDVSAGASGAIFGVLGAHIPLNRRLKREGRLETRQAFVGVGYVIFVFVQSWVLLPNVNILAHLRRGSNRGRPRFCIMSSDTFLVKLPAQRSQGGAS